MKNPLFPRSAGILLHPTSLPGPYAMGDLGAVPALLDWMHQAGLTVWQVLPLVQTGGGNSPYSSQSALSANTLLLAFSGLVADKLLHPHELPPPLESLEKVDFQAVHALKLPLLEKAADRLVNDHAHPLHPRFIRYVHQQPWAVDAALFQAIRAEQKHQPWWHWPLPLRKRDPQALAEAEKRLKLQVNRYVALQFLFDRQWQWLAEHARHRGIRIFGDVPIYVDGDSVETWKHPHLFQLDAHLQPKKVSGVPPDYFAKLGQFWGNPLYDWPAMARDHYAWWTQRMQRALTHVDVVRIDHFRGFAAYWAIPRQAPDATHGSWQRGPGLPLFAALKKSLGQLPMIAEDLGVMDDAVTTLRDKSGLPGMKVLQFAFGDNATNPFLPHHHTEHCVVYTGTHDNDTTLGWWNATPELHGKVRQYLGEVDADTIAKVLVKTAMASVAHTAIIPAQDFLELGTEARMNVPGLTAENWAWRMKPGALDPHLASQIRRQVELFDRLQP